MYECTYVGVYVHVYTSTRRQMYIYVKGFESYISVEDRVGLSGKQLIMNAPKEKGFLQCMHDIMQLNIHTPISLFWGQWLSVIDQLSAGQNARH